MSTDDSEQGNVIPAWRMSVERWAHRLQRLGLPDLKMSEVAIYLGVVFGLLILWIVSTGIRALRKIERGERIVA
jgi:hypothetical protein